MSTLDRVVRGGLLMMTAPLLSVIYENGSNQMSDETKAFYILDNITYLGADLCQSTADRCSTGVHASDKLCSSQPNASTPDLRPQADLLSKVLQIRSDQQPAGWPCNVSAAAAAPATDPRVFKLGHAPILDFAHVIDFILMEAQGLDEEHSCASLRSLTLCGLPQGRAVPGSANGRNSSIHWHPTEGLGRRLSFAPDAAAAAAAAAAAPRGLGRRLLSYTGGPMPRMLTQGTPDVWTLMMWSITRCGSSSSWCNLFLMIFGVARDLPGDI
jgi:hypothetical protein